MLMLRPQICKCTDDENNKVEFDIDTKTFKSALIISLLIMPPNVTDSATNKGTGKSNHIANEDYVNNNDVDLMNKEGQTLECTPAMMDEAAFSVADSHILCDSL